MTIITPNSISGISSITAQSGTLEFYNASGSIMSVTGNVTGNVNSSGVSTFATLRATSLVGVTTAGITTVYATELRGSSNTITIPTGQRVIGVDAGGFIAPGMLLQRQVKVFTAEVQLAQQSHLTIFTSDTFNLRRASSRVYITVIAHHGKRASGEHQFSVRALRNGTIVTQNMSSADGVTFDVERGPDTANAVLHELTPFAFYDEPNTTENLTYVFQAARPAAYSTVFFNFGGNTGRSVMILEEIAQ